MRSVTLDVLTVIAHMLFDPFMLRRWLFYPWIINVSILAVNKADILGRFAMPISRYYMQGINSTLLHTWANKVSLGGPFRVVK
jgi:nitric oxide reductase large subunit